MNTILMVDIVRGVCTQYPTVLQWIMDNLRHAGEPPGMLSPALPKTNPRHLMEKKYQMLPCWCKLSPWLCMFVSIECLNGFDMWTKWRTIRRTGHWTIETHRYLPRQLGTICSDRSRSGQGGQGAEAQPLNTWRTGSRLSKLRPSLPRSILVWNACGRDCHARIEFQISRFSRCFSRGPVLTNQGATIITWERRIPTTRRHLHSVSFR